jgi:hypothetical protein
VSSTTPSTSPTIDPDEAAHLWAYSVELTGVDGFTDR